MRRATALFGLMAICALSLRLTAFQPPAQQGPKIVEVEKVKDNLYMLKGGGGNTAVFVGTNGITGLSSLSSASPMQATSSPERISRCST